MNDLGLRDAFFDLSGQRVDTQFNAESIVHVVNHLSDGQNGKRCSFCLASPMRQTQVVWAENTRRAGGRTTILSNVALRVAPPMRPPAPPRRPVHTVPAAYTVHYAVCVLLATMATPILFALLVATLRPSEKTLNGLIALFALATLAVLVLGIMLAQRKISETKATAANAEEKAEEEFAQAMRSYEIHLTRDQQLFEQWQRSWFCTSCGRILVEQPDPAANQ